MGICQIAHTTQDNITLLCWLCQDIHAATVSTGGIWPFNSWRECTLSTKTSLQFTIAIDSSTPMSSTANWKNFPLIIQILCLQQTFSTPSGMCLQYPHIHQRRLLLLLPSFSGSPSWIMAFNKSTSPWLINAFSVHPCTQKHPTSSRTLIHTKYGNIQR